LVKEQGTVYKLKRP